MHRGEAIGRLYLGAPADSPRARLASRAVDPVSGRMCLLLGRLYYKADLMRNLSALRGQAFASDAALALAVFNSRGPMGLAQLEGEFSLVVSDPADRCLYALRDPLGSWPLYWVASAARLRAGTSLLDLGRRLGNTAVNLDHVGAFLMCPFAIVELPREDTALAPIRRVPPGCLLRLDAAGRPTTLHEHTWPTPAKEGGLDADRAGRRFLELFRSAVRERLEPGSTTAHLSGGMDSSAVVCVARDLLSAEKEAPPLNTLSVVYRQGALAGEESYIRLVLDQGGPVVSHYLDGDSLLGFDWFSSGVPDHDEPYTFLHQLASDVRRMDAAEANGSTTLLTGHGAELVAEGMGFYLADLLREGRWITALRAARESARAESASLWSVLRHQGLQPLVPGRLRDGVGTMCRRGCARLPHVGRSAVPPWVRPWFARKNRLWEKGREIVGQLFQAPYEESASRFAAVGQIGDWFSWHVAGPRGLHTGKPFLDPRLIAFSLSLPHRLRLQPGVVKPLLQSAMKGILPEPIRTRRWKRHFGDPYGGGLSRRLGALETMIQRSPIADLDIIDRTMLRTVLRQVSVGLSRGYTSFRMDSTLALIAWYDQLGPALARPADEPTEVVQSGREGETERSGYVSCR
jgi:asparagine synthase (glutamine-hydrolysing)